MRHPMPRRRDDACARGGGVRPKAAKVCATHTHRNTHRRIKAGRCRKGLAARVEFDTVASPSPAEIAGIKIRRVVAGNDILR